MPVTENSARVIGAELELKQLSENSSGLNSNFRRTGEIMGFTLDFTIVVPTGLKTGRKLGKQLV